MITLDRLPGLYKWIANISFAADIVDYTALTIHLAYQFKSFISTFKSIIFLFCICNMQCRLLINVPYYCAVLLHYRHELCVMAMGLLCSMTKDEYILKFLTVSISLWFFPNFSWKLICRNLQGFNVSCDEHYTTLTFHKTPTSIIYLSICKHNFSHDIQIIVAVVLFDFCCIFPSRRFVNYISAFRQIDKWLPFGMYRAYIE